MQTLASDNPQSWLVWFLKGILVLGFVILIARLTELQVIKGNYYWALAEGNRIKKVSIIAARGEILARGGEKLIGNVISKKRIVYDSQSGIGKTDADEESNGDDILSEWKRIYYLGADFSHVGGYLGLASDNEINKVDPECIDKGPILVDSVVGRSGLEQQYSCALRGINGEQLLELDSSGKPVRVLGTKNPIPGKNITTTIDFGLQQKVVSAYKNAKDLPTNRAGAVIATDGKGEVLAYYSSPSFDPANVNQSVTDKNLPLFDRVISGAYHPGSTFKLSVAIAALESGLIDKNYTYNDTGIITVNEFSYTNWYFTQYGRTEGNIDLTRAIARSTDTFFYKVGEMVGPQRIAQWANTFGFGKKTGIDLPGEVSGLVPTPQWKEETKNENWFLGNTYHMAIGQGDVTATPLQANVMTSVIAQNGELCQPHLVTDLNKNYCQKINIQQKNLDLVKQGMIGACSTGGTAFPFFDFTPQVACKTGTAETFDENKTHAWFTAFAPVEDPEIVVTVLVENGGEGSQVAAPIARDILNYWFNER